jgi:hypothetical protein
MEPETGRFRAADLQVPLESAASPAALFEVDE